MKPNMKEFWEQRYKKEGTIWSNNPSKSAIYAADFFQMHPIQNLRILGIGYRKIPDLLLKVDI